MFLAVVRQQTERVSLSIRLYCIKNRNKCGRTYVRLSDTAECSSGDTQFNTGNFNFAGSKTYHQCAQKYYSTWGCHSDILVAPCLNCGSGNCFYNLQVGVLAVPIFIFISDTADV